MRDADRSASAADPAGYVRASEATRMLDVKRETLYAYVSRGILRSIAAPHGRARLYALEDLRRLKSRRDARRGHVAVAATALDWGAPVLDSAITRIDERGPHYRGHCAVDLARAGTPFEDVCELLWASELSPRPPAPLPAALRVALARAASAVVPGSEPLGVLAALLPIASLCDADRYAGSDAAEHARARVLLRAMACALRLPRHAQPAEPRKGERLAELLCRALGVAASDAHARAIDEMLVLSADHELNVSAFGVRVTASSGADLYACLCAGLAALSGPWHGGMCNRVEALVHECAHARHVREVLRERVRLDKVIPGFGHPLYTEPDPRGELLLQRARKLGSGRPELKCMNAIAAHMSETHRLHPTVDFGLVALAFALRLPAGSAAALFALGRTAGWVAHALEQRAQRHLLRPRARYVGVSPSTT